ncbi:MAG TPA: hypothetical protein VFX60_01955 [Micromonospora sp.]|nr:hypothetical protein [Micromonospora sp.]
MPDEFQQRYEHLSHRQLYSQLMAGDPEQVERLASQWSSLQTTADGLARSLQSDLNKLTAGWSSAAGTEFSRRIGLIKTFADNLAAEFGNVDRGLMLMAGPLRRAKAQAEHPDETDDHDKAVKGAVVGGVIGGPAGAVVGGFFGHRQDQAEQERARKRMVQLIAGLAAEYDVTDHANWPVQVVSPPPDLPRGTSDDSSSPTRGPQVAAPTAAPKSGTSTGIQRADVAAPQTPREAPSSGASQAAVGMGFAGSGGSAGGEGLLGADQDEYGTSLAGTGGASGPTVSGWAAGAGGAALAAGGAAPRPGMPAGPPPAQAPMPSAGVLGAATGMSGAEGKAATTAGRGAGMRAQHGGGNLSRGAQDVIGRSGADANRSAAGTRPAVGSATEADERLTWLTEDEMVWHGDEHAAPSVLGTETA